MCLGAAAQFGRPAEGCLPTPPRPRALASSHPGDPSKQSPHQPSPPPLSHHVQLPHQCPVTAPWKPGGSVTGRQALGGSALPALATLDPAADHDLAPANDFDAPVRSFCRQAFTACALCARDHRARGHSRERTRPRPLPSRASTLATSSRSLSPAWNRGDSGNQYVNKEVKSLLQAHRNVPRDPLRGGVRRNRPAEHQNQAPGSLRPPGARASSLTHGPRGLPAPPPSPVQVRPRRQRPTPALRPPDARPDAQRLASLLCEARAESPPAPRAATSLYTRLSNARDRPPAQALANVRRCPSFSFRPFWCLRLAFPE